MPIPSVLVPLKWGVQSSAGAAVDVETTSTLGTARTNERTPPSTSHIDGDQLAAFLSFDNTLSQHFKGGSRARFYPVSSSPFGSGEHGLWALYAASGPQYLQYTTAGVAFKVPFTAGASAVTFSATPTFAPTTSDFLTITMTANITSWTFSAGFDGQIVTIGFVQDGTGSRTLAAPPANVTVAGGTLTLTTTANKRDYVTWRYEGSTSKWREICRALNQ